MERSSSISPCINTPAPSVRWLRTADPRQTLDYQVLPELCFPMSNRDCFQSLLLDVGRSYDTGKTVSG
jgi:hypothetical protein